MFYNQPQTTDGMYSRGGMLFYSSILLAWLQMSELEDAMQGRDIISRQKKFAFVRPSAVCLARVLSDVVVSLLITALYMIVVYFLAGLKTNVRLARTCLVGFRRYLSRKREHSLTFHTGGTTGWRVFH